MKVVIVLAMTALLCSADAFSFRPKAANKKMVCYFGSWAAKRPGNGKFDVEDIDPNLCTHLIYAFASLGNDNTLVQVNPSHDEGAMTEFTALKNQNSDLKTLLSVGGWADGSEKYSKMASVPAERTKFVESAVKFLVKYNFDGLDFDWEFPTQRGGVPEDKANFVKLLRELRTAFQDHNLMLTVAVSSGKQTIDAAYDILAINSVVDQIHLMGYDYHGDWEQLTGHNSPLYQNPSIDTGNNAVLNLDFSVNYLIQHGATAAKIVLGLPTYGRGFVLTNAAENGLYAPVSGPLEAGPYTQAPGVLGYNEICEQNIPDTWTVVLDPQYSAPYAYNGKKWIGYDDPKSLATKADYIVQKGLGGAAVWSLDTDKCNNAPFVLTKSIRDGMTVRQHYKY